MTFRHQLVRRGFVRGDHVPMANRTLGRIWPTALFILLTLIVGGCSSASPLTVDQLVSKFQSNRQHFESVLQRAPASGSFGVEIDEYGAKPSGITQKGANGYVSDLEAIGATDLQVSDGDVEVILGRTGMVSSGTDWGYIHPLDPPQGIVSLERAREPVQDDGWYYPLGAGWYAYVTQY